MFQIFLISFLLNLVWEVNHSALYKTCYELTFKKCMRLLTVMSIKDGFWISLFYTITVFVFDSANPILNIAQFVLFIIISLGFSFIDEKISIKKERWKYTEEMPIIFGVGVSPFLELAVTGAIAFFIVFYIF